MSKMHDSIMSETFLPFGVNVGKNRGFSVDSGSTLSIVSSSFGSNTTGVRISLKKDLK